MASDAEEQLRIVILAPPLSVVGGHSVQAFRLLSALAGLGVHAEVLEFPPEPDTAALRITQKIGGIRTIANIAAVQARLVRRIRSFDIVHIFGAAYWSMLWLPLPSIMVAKLAKRPAILNFHDGRAEEMLERMPWCAPAFRLADCVVAPSQYLVDVFQRHGIHAETVFNSVEPERFRFRERSDLRPVFLHNRGFEELYNVPCMLRAFGLVQEQRPDARLLLPHDGPLRSELEALVRDLGLRDVEFLGEVSAERMRNLYDEADIFWMSPNIDNMPLSVLECYASGLPVISTEAGGVPYTVENERTGLLVPLNDHAAMAQAALRLLDDPDLARRLSRAGREEVTKYQPEATAREWVRVYREVGAR